MCSLETEEKTSQVKKLRDDENNECVGEKKKQASNEVQKNLLIDLSNETQKVANSWVSFVFLLISKKKKKTQRDVFVSMTKKIPFIFFVFLMREMNFLIARFVSRRKTEICWARRRKNRWETAYRWRPWDKRVRARLRATTWYRDQLQASKSKTPGENLTRSISCARSRRSERPTTSGTCRWLRASGNICRSTIVRKNRRLVNVHEKQNKKKQKKSATNRFCFQNSMNCWRRQKWKIFQWISAIKSIAILFHFLDQKIKHIVSNYDGCN